ncbi:hypothetical protein ACQ4PT_021009 [Festuca glaucescens]
MKAALKPQRALTENCSRHGLEIEVLVDTTAATVGTATGVAATGEADAAEESLKDDVYTGEAYRDLEKLHRLVEREGRSVVPNTPTEHVRELLATTWAHDPLTTLKLVCNLRGVRGTGKSDKEGFYAAALWMHAEHPKTLACNVAALAEFGYLKDFPELLFKRVPLLHGIESFKYVQQASSVIILYCILGCILGRCYHVPTVSIEVALAQGLDKAELDVEQDQRM